MQAVIQPAVHPVARAVRADDTPGLRVDVVPRVGRIVQPRENHRQRPLPAAIEIVRVVLIEDANIRHRVAAGRLRHQIDDLLRIERRPRRPVNRHDAGRATGERGQINGIAGK